MAPAKILVLVVARVTMLIVLFVAALLTVAGSGVAEIALKVLAHHLEAVAAEAPLLGACWILAERKARILLLRVNEHAMNFTGGGFNVLTYRPASRLKRGCHSLLHSFRHLYGVSLVAKLIPQGLARHEEQRRDLVNGRR